MNEMKNSLRLKTLMYNSSSGKIVIVFFINEMKNSLRLKALMYNSSSDAFVIYESYQILIIIV